MLPIKNVSVWEIRIDTDGLEYRFNWVGYDLEGTWTPSSVWFPNWEELWEIKEHKASGRKYRWDGSAWNLMALETSNFTDTDWLLTFNRVITSAELLTMWTVPLELIPWVAGKYTVVEEIFVWLWFVTTPYDTATWFSILNAAGVVGSHWTILSSMDSGLYKVTVYAGLLILGWWINAVVTDGMWIMSWTDPLNWDSTITLVIKYKLI